MKTFNGKPMSHWERMGKKLVIEQLVRASQCGEQTGKTPVALPNKIAHDRLMQLAEQEDPELFKEVVEERATMRRGIALLLSEFGAPRGGQKRKHRARRRSATR